MNKLSHFFLICLITSALTAQDNKNIVVLGSSTAAGFAIDPIDSSWVNLFADSLSELNSNLHVINLAQFGFTTYDILPSSINKTPANRPKEDTQRNITAALAYNPIAIIINLPSNGAAYFYTVEEQLANYETIIKIIKEKNIPLWICSPQPRSDFSSLQMNIQLALKDSMFSMYKDMLIDFWSGIAAENGGIESQFNLGDDIHLNKKGHNVLFKRAAAIIFPYLSEYKFFKKNKETNSPSILLDDFENINDWNIYKSDNVDASISSTDGYSGKAIKFYYNFTKGSGYGGIQKVIPIDLPENFQFTFYLKAESPSNNFEIKFLDSSGVNVWWVNNRNYLFPNDWKRIRIKKRHIDFAWGPTEDKSLTRIDRVEFTVASYVGGSGTVYIDELKFEELPPETQIYPEPVYLSSSSRADHPIEFAFDKNLNKKWISISGQNQFIQIDFQKPKEFGGIHIEWSDTLKAQAFDILLSDDGTEWENVYSVSSNASRRSFIRLPESEARFVKINLLKGNSDFGFGVREISFIDIKNSETLNDFLLYVAGNSHWTDFPRYFYKYATYWTTIGVNNDVKEALINEDGMVEVDKSGFSIEPLIRTKVLYNWAIDYQTQSLEENYLPIPKVSWDLTNGIDFEVKAFANGEANKSSILYLKYSLKNSSSKNNKEGEFYLVIRPFQVNPYYQWLNISGGSTKINSLEEKNGRIYVNNEKVVVPISTYDSFGASAFDEGNIAQFLRKGNIPTNKSVIDPTNLASGVLKYEFDLKPGEEKVIYLAVPFYGEESLLENLNEEIIEHKLKETIDFWNSKVNHIKFNLPESADRIVNSFKSNLAYILINKDKAGIQPGSRSYERSWIRDGSLTSAALLRSGITDEVRNFIEWYSPYQFENGKVPCVVDSRGPDPVPEHDSNGELIYLIKQYFNFTKDTAFLSSQNKYVVNAVDYIQSLISERSTDHFKYGNDSVRAYYGILPESISHEGYSAKPMHSYWDNFFAMKGLKDAADIQLILGNDDEYKRIAAIRDKFKSNLYNSLQLAIKTRGIDYIPGSVELGDFDATSTAIALYPTNEYQHVPQPYLNNTFEKYYEFFTKRKNDEIDWTAYTPYENRLIGSFIFLDQPERAHELIDFFLDDQRPQGWNHWAEVVWKEERHPGFIGDMPHTWVGSDFINAIRSMFVYEKESDSSLVLGAGLYQDWIDAEDGMSVENLPTYYGELSYSIIKKNNKYEINIYGDLEIPSGGIVLKNFNQSRLPIEVLVNGKAIKNYNQHRIHVKEFPAKVIIDYEN